MTDCDCDYWDSKHRWHCATNYPTPAPVTGETTDAGEGEGARLVAHPQPGKVWVQIPHRNDIGSDWIAVDELAATPDAADASGCGAIPPNVGGLVPCALPSGHDGQHFSTTGCAGSEIRWDDASTGASEGLSEAIGMSLYESLMEASADQWRRWEFMTDAAKEIYRAEAGRIISVAIEPVIAARVSAAATRAADDRAERIAQAIEGHRARGIWGAGRDAYEDCATIARTTP